MVLASGRATEDSPVERADPRLPTATHLVAQLRAREAPTSLEALGMRWIAVLDTADPSYDDLEDLPVGDLRLEVAVRGPSLTLYRVVGWYGPAVDDRHDVDVDSPISPLAWVESSNRVTWLRAGSGGWLRGWHRASTESNGNLVVPAGSGPLWYALHSWCSWPMEWSWGH